MKRLVCTALVALLLVTLLGGCAAETKDTAATTKPSTTTTTTPPTTPTTTPTVPNDEPKEQNYNPLTGLNDLEGEKNRPVAIMVPNDSAVIGYQMGLDKADFYMECETEGAIPRIMAVFANADRIPDTFGPIRSGRSPFVHTANAFGFLYVFSGATTHVDKYMASLKGFDFMEAGKYGSPTFWRDSYLGSQINKWQNLVTGGAKLSAKIEERGFATTKVKELPFVFGEKSGSITANTVKLKTTPGHTASFVYDENTGVYKKNIVRSSGTKPHVTLAGDQITASNVLVLYAEKYVEFKNEKYTWVNFRTGTGSGYIVSGGTAREIKFNRTATDITFTEADGKTPLTFAEGKTYMVLADKDLSDDISFS